MHWVRAYLNRNGEIRPLLNKKVFPVYRPGGLKRADWDFFFMIFEEKKKSQSSWYILVNEKIKTEKKKHSRPPDWLFWQSPGGQETIFYLRVA